MWAHCFLMDWPGRASPQAKVQQQSPAVRTALPCSGPRPGELLLPAPCQVHWNTARWSAGQCAVRVLKPTLAGTGAKTVKTVALWAHFAHLDFRLCPALFYIIFPLSWFHFLPTLPPHLRLCQGLYSISSFTYCVRFVFPVSYLASWFTFFSYLINLCLPQSVCVCVFVAVCLCVCVPVALWLLPMSENCPLRVIYFKALLGLELELELGRVSNLNFIFFATSNFIHCAT